MLQFEPNTIDQKTLEFMGFRPNAVMDWDKFLSELITSMKDPIWAYTEIVLPGEYPEWCEPFVHVADDEDVIHLKHIATHLETITTAST
jgi:hypothetical protein